MNGHISLIIQLAAILLVCTGLALFLGWMLGKRSARAKAAKAAAEAATPFTAAPGAAGSQPESLAARKLEEQESPLTATQAAPLMVAATPGAQPVAEAQEMVPQSNSSPFAPDPALYTAPAASADPAAAPQAVPARSMPDPLSDDTVLGEPDELSPAAQDIAAPVAARAEDAEDNAQRPDYLNDQTVSDESTIETHMIPRIINDTPAPTPQPALDSRLLEAESRANEAEARVREAEAKLEEANQRAHEAEAKAEEASQRVTQAEERLTQAEAKAEEAGQRVTEADQRFSEAESRAAEASQIAREAEDRATQAEAKAQEAEQHITRAEEAHRQVVELEEQINKQEIDMARLENRATAAWDKTMPGLFDRIESLEDELSQARRETAELQALLDAEHEERQARIDVEREQAKAGTTPEAGESAPEEQAGDTAQESVPETSAVIKEEPWQAIGSGTEMPITADEHAPEPQTQDTEDTAQESVPETTTVIKEEPWQAIGSENEAADMPIGSASDALPGTQQEEQREQAAQEAPAQQDEAPEPEAPEETEESRTAAEDSRNSERQKSAEEKPEVPDTAEESGETITGQDSGESEKTDVTGLRESGTKDSEAEKPEAAESGKSDSGETEKAEAARDENREDKDSAELEDTESEGSGTGVVESEAAPAGQHEDGETSHAEKPEAAQCEEAGVGDLETAEKAEENSPENTGAETTGNEVAKEGGEQQAAPSLEEAPAKAVANAQAVQKRAKDTAGQPDSITEHDASQRAENAENTGKADAATSSADPRPDEHQDAAAAPETEEPKTGEQSVPTAPAGPEDVVTTAEPADPTESGESGEPGESAAEETEQAEKTGQAAPGVERPTHEIPAVTHQDPAGPRPEEQTGPRLVPLIPEPVFTEFSEFVAQRAEYREAAEAAAAREEETREHVFPDFEEQTETRLIPAIKDPGEAPETPRKVAPPVAIYEAAHRTADPTELAADPLKPSPAVNGAQPMAHYTPLTAVFRDLAPRTAPIAEPEMEHHIPTSEVYPVVTHNESTTARTAPPSADEAAEHHDDPARPGSWAGSPVPHATPHFIDAGEPLPAELNDETEVDEPSAAEQTLRLDMHAGHLATAARLRMPEQRDGVMRSPLEPRNQQLSISLEDDYTDVDPIDDNIAVMDPDDDYPASVRIPPEDYPQAR